MVSVAGRIDAAPPITVGTVRDEDSFEALREEWTTLLSSSRANCLFLTWEWLFTWWRHFGRGWKLSILTVHAGEHLVGLAPFGLRPLISRLWPVSQLAFLGEGSVGTDYPDIIVRLGYEDVTLQALAAHFAARNLPVRFTRIISDGAAASHLGRELASQGWHVTPRIADVSPFIDLSDHNWTTYLDSLGSALRYNFRRRLRNLQKLGDLRFERADTEDRCRQALDRLVAFHNQRWDKRGGSEAFHTPELVRFHHEFTQLAFERGWLRLLTLSIDNVPVSLLYCLRYGRSFLGYQSGFDLAYSKHSVGLVSTGLAIRAAVEEGATEYDFLHGDEEYKSHWADRKRSLTSLDLYPSGIHGLAVRHGVELHRAVRWVAKRASLRATAALAGVGALMYADRTP